MHNLEDLTKVIKRQQAIIFVLLLSLVALAILLNESYKLRELVYRNGQSSVRDRQKIIN